MALASMAYCRGQVQARSCCWFGRCPEGTPAIGAGQPRIRQNLIIVLRTIGIGATVLQLQLVTRGCFVQTCEGDAKHRIEFSIKCSLGVVVQCPRCYARCSCVLSSPWQAELLLRRLPIIALRLPLRGSSSAGAATGHAAAASEHAHLRLPGQRSSCYLNLLAACGPRACWMSGEAISLPPVYCYPEGRCGCRKELEPTGAAGGGKMHTMWSLSRVQRGGLHCFWQAAGRLAMQTDAVRRACALG
jgi:hypothetical protein